MGHVQIEIMIDKNIRELDAYKAAYKGAQSSKIASAIENLIGVLKNIRAEFHGGKSYTSKMNFVEAIGKLVQAYNVETYPSIKQNGEVLKTYISKDGSFNKVEVPNFKDARVDTLEDGETPTNPGIAEALVSKKDYYNAVK